MERLPAASFMARLGWEWIGEQAAGVRFRGLPAIEMHAARELFARARHGTAL
nr:unnamed protein product [Digitaria exilis]